MHVSTPLKGRPGARHATFHSHHPKWAVARSKGESLITIVLAITFGTSRFDAITRFIDIFDIASLPHVLFPQAAPPPHHISLLAAFRLSGPPLRASWPLL